MGLQGQSGNLSLVVEKAEIKEETISETIPMEWLPRPKVTGFDAEGTKEITYTETADAVSAAISFSGAMPIEDWEMTLDFADPVYKSLNKKYTFSTLTEEDRTSLTQAGIVLPSLDEAKDGKIDFTGLTEKLQVASNDETTNTIKLRVKANNRWSSEEGEEDAFTIKTIAPEIVPTAEPEDIWTKTLTISGCEVKTGKLDPSTIQEYQYLDGSEWHDCADGLAALSDIPADNQMQVRAMYREGVYAKPVTIKLEKPEQLPNSGMEEWYIETKKKESPSGLLKPKTYYTFHPYATGAANSSWWDTNNDKAQGGTYAFGIWYEGCFASCVSYTEDAHSGSKAALMYLSGCGDGYANASGTYVGGAMVGSLFIGSYSNGIVQGHDFGVRPTSLTFWYKYKPYNSDAFKVVVSLKNGEKEIATGIYEPTAYSSEDGEYKQASVDFNYSVENEKATTICVQFLASNKTDLSESDFNKGTTITYPVIGNWTVHMGSVLKIDDISLVYDK